MTSNTQVLPLTEAYPFGDANGLGDEIAKIREMPIEWNRTRLNTALRRGYVIALFERHGIWERFKTECWPNGNTHKGQVKCRWYLGLRQQHEDLLAGRGSDDEAEAEEVTEEEESQSFARENDLRDFLAKNLNRIEPGLTLYSGDGRSGVEFVIEDGRIDLLTVDREGRLVVIELKVSRGRNKTIGQLLFYMGWVDKNLSKGKKCRGMIIAREITDDLVLAVQRVPGVSLCRYILSVTVEPVAAMAQ